MQQGWTETFERQLQEITAVEAFGGEASDIVANTEIQDRPRAVIRCGSTQIIADIIKSVRGTGVPLAVSGGGYSFAGLGCVDDGLTLSLSALTSIEVDAEAQTVRIGGGVKTGALESALAEYGLSLTLPVPSGPGVVGAALSGGIGFLIRKLGLTSDALLSATVVTGTGEIIEADDLSHPELMWALRGGGGNFGIITEAVFGLHPVGAVSVAQCVYELDSAAEQLAFYRTWTEELDADATAVVMLRRCPPLRGAPAELIGQPVMMLSVVHAGPLAAADGDFASLTQRGGAVTQNVSRMELADLRHITDAGFPYARFGAKVRSGWVAELTDGNISSIVTAARSMPPGDSLIELARMQGAVQTPARPSCAPHRDAAFLLNVMALWTSQQERDPVVSWLNEQSETIAAMHIDGAHVPGFVSDDELNHADATYGPYLGRLRRIKTQYDPDNLLRNNLNITPWTAG